jgi:NAD(P)-dependent dehydrogenase (short-subunit alcohol dehydrogenase family)
MVLALAGAGADVAIGARRSGPIEAVAEQVRQLGRRALAVSTDVTDSAQCERLLDAAEQELGPLEILVNNAGLDRATPRGKPLVEITDEEWRRGIDINLSGAFFCARGAARRMVPRKRGAILNIASGWAYRGGRNYFMYSCAKAGVVALTRSLAVTLQPDGVRAVGLAPGFFATDPPTTDATKSVRISASADASSRSGGSARRRRSARWRCSWCPTPALT